MTKKTEQELDAEGRVVVAKITDDLLDLGDAFNRVGYSWTMAKDNTETEHVLAAPKVRFRCKDDDGEVYYKGWLYNYTADDGEMIQDRVNRWAIADAGAVHIEIKDEKTGKWVQEIG